MPDVIQWLVGFLAALFMVSGLIAFVRALQPEAAAVFVLFLALDALFVLAWVSHA